MAVWSHVWRWRAQHPERFGAPCRIAAFSDYSRQVLIEFQDGFRVLVARSAVKALRTKPLTVSDSRVGG